MGYAEIHFDTDTCDLCGKRIPRSEGRTFHRPAYEDEPREALMFLCARCWRGWMS